MPSLARIEMVMLLQSAELFTFCTAEEVVRIAAIAQERRFLESEKIYKTSDPADALYCVVDGEVSLMGENGQTETVRPKGTFGVLEILSGRLRSSDATAEEETVTLAIEADDFFDLLSNNIDIVKALFREVISDVQKGAAGGGLK